MNLVFFGWPTTFSTNSLQTYRQQQNAYFTLIYLNYNYNYGAGSGGVRVVGSDALLFKTTYSQVSNIRRTLTGNKIVDHSHVVGALPVGAAPTTASFST